MGTAVRTPVQLLEGRIETIIDVIEIVCIGFFSVSWLRRLATTSRNQARTSAHGWAESREARFRKIASTDSKKFEAAYVVVEAIALFVLFVALPYTLDELD